jgi:hypothetical protein
MRRFKSAVQLASLVIVMITGALAAAQEFPTKPIELAVPYAAGGSHDLTARALASVAHQYLGQLSLHTFLSHWDKSAASCKKKDFRQSSSG